MNSSKKSETIYNDVDPVTLLSNNNWE